MQVLHVNSLVSLNMVGYNYDIFCHLVVIIMLATSIGAIAARNSYTENNLPMYIIDLNCTGMEQSITDCPHNSLVGIHSCGSREDASLRCQGIFFFSFVYIYSYRKQ